MFRKVNKETLYMKNKDNDDERIWTRWL